MSRIEFIVYYATAVSFLVLMIVIIRFSMLKPMLAAKRLSASVIENYKDEMGCLLQVGVKVDGKGPINFITPPPYVPDEELIPDKRIYVWVADNSLGMVFSTKPSLLLLLGRALHPAIAVGFMLMIPMMFILYARSFHTL